MRQKSKPSLPPPEVLSKQHIERDTNNPRIWDIDNSKILTIHLIDARTFKLLAGLDPPETPVTPDVYKKLGLPFFQLPETREGVDGVAGQWGRMKGAKSVAATNLKVGSKSMMKGTVTTDRSPQEDGIDGSARGEAESWGVFSLGQWGRLRNEAESDPPKEDAGHYKDASFDFPLVLLDVDESIPKFKSVIDVESHDYEWADGVGFHPS